MLEEDKFLFIKTCVLKNFIIKYLVYYNVYCTMMSITNLYVLLKNKKPSLNKK